MNDTILIVEDEPDIRQMLRFSLEQANYQIVEAQDVSEANHCIASQRPDLILLDWMLPNTTGLQYVKQLKKEALTKDIPVIMLTAKVEEDNKITGLESGADDYVTKPFSPRELIARIKTVLRRGPLKSPDEKIELANLCIDCHAHQCYVDQQVVNLSATEFRLLLCFVRHQNRVFSREQLLDFVWGGDKELDERSVDVQILRLRKILKRHHVIPTIETVHGIGYKLTVPIHHE